MCTSVWVLYNHWFHSSINSLLNQNLKNNEREKVKKHYERQLKSLYEYKIHLKYQNVVTALSKYVCCVFYSLFIATLAMFQLLLYLVEKIFLLLEDEIQIVNLTDRFFSLMPVYFSDVKICKPNFHLST